MKKINYLASAYLILSLCPLHSTATEYTGHYADKEVYILGKYNNKDNAPLEDGPNEYDSYYFLDGDIGNDYGKQRFLSEKLCKGNKEIGIYTSGGFTHYPNGFSSGFGMGAGNKPSFPEKKKASIKLIHHDLGGNNLTGEEMRELRKKYNHFQIIQRETDNHYEKIKQRWGKRDTNRANIFMIVKRVKRINKRAPKYEIIEGDETIFEQKDIDSDEEDIESDDKASSLPGDNKNLNTNRGKALQPSQRIIKQPDQIIQPEHQPNPPTPPKNSQHSDKNKDSNKLPYIILGGVLVAVGIYLLIKPKKKLKKIKDTSDRK